MDNIIIKYNSGIGAILCSKCSAIIKVGYEFTEDERKAMKGELHMGPIYCTECKEGPFGYKKQNELTKK